MKTKAYFILIFLSLCLSTRAQFFSLGADPGQTAWKQITTEHYRIIYPEFADSLGFSYARQLERFYPYESLSTGYAPTQAFKNKFPITIHPFSATANGMVAWSPRRMSLLTLPDAGFMTQISWTSSLAVHESRHLSQNMIGYNKWLNPLRYPFGEGAASAAALLYQMQHFTEGDAVIAETALTRGGRGRNWNFQDYLLMALDKGDVRTYQRWLCGSTKNYTPDRYTFGYTVLGSVRSMYDEPMLMYNYLHQCENPLHLDMNGHAIREISGKKETSDDFWQDVVEWNIAEFRKRADQRGPFSPIDTLHHADHHRHYTEYSGGTLVDGKHIYVIKYSFDKAYEFVCINLEDGTEKSLGTFSGTASTIVYNEDTHRLYWSEHTPTAWDLKIDSKICFYDLVTKTFGVLTNSDHILQNPNATKEGLVACEYCPDGTYAMVLVSYKGKILKSLKTPSGVQPTDGDILEGKLYMVGLSDEGNAIYEYLDGEWKMLTKPVHASMNVFAVEEDHFHFSSDRGGVEEFYIWYPSTGEYFRMTNQRYGGTDFMHEGDSVYYFVPDLKGNALVAAKCEEVKVDFENQGASWWIADKISAQEDSLAIASGLEPSSQVFDKPFDTEISQPQPYRKIRNLGGIHTWIPGIYAPYSQENDIDGTLAQGALGATAFFQNDLGTSSGYIGLKYAPDPYAQPLWRPSLHFNWDYIGRLPHIGLSIDYGDRNAMEISRYCTVGLMGEKILTERQGVASHLSSTNHLSANINLSLPLTCGRMGRYFRLTPQASLSVSNDMYDRKIRPYFLNPDETDNNLAYPKNCGYVPDLTFTKVLSTSLTASTYTYVPKACYYSRFSASAQLGYVARLGTGDFFTALGYGSVNMTLPGPGISGFKLSAAIQKPIGKGEYLGPLIMILPRGFSSYGNTSIFHVSNPTYRLTLDYAIPFNLDGVNIADLFYFNRVNVIPFFDFSSRVNILRPSSVSTSSPIQTVPFNNSLCSAGLTLSLGVQHLVIIYGDFDLGIMAAYNFGHGFNSLGFTPDNRFYIAPVFSATF